MIELNSKEEIEEFIKPPDSNENWLKVVVYILDDDREEDSLYYNYHQTCHDLVNWINTSTAVVTNTKLIKELKKQNFIIYYETV
mmetsp:Transcript_9907/g.1467  ORF Transcript_9907/g.1467 Transcript_9907/m.1467 type:complete len:84 (+) Transcript_9907:424-675(+)